MDIVHVGFGYGTEALDGRVRAVSAYARGLAARGHNVTLVTLSKTLPSSESIGLDYGIREVALRTPALPLHLGAEAEAFFSGPAGAADVYHFHSSAARHCLAARRLSAPYVVTPTALICPRTSITAAPGTSPFGCCSAAHI